MNKKNREVPIELGALILYASNKYQIHANIDVIPRIRNKSPILQTMASHHDMRLFSEVMKESFQNSFYEFKSDWIF